MWQGLALKVVERGDFRSSLPTLRAERIKRRKTPYCVVMGISDSISKEASKYYTILILALLVGGGTFWLTQKLEISIIVGAITIIIIWLKVLTDDTSKIKKKLHMEEAE